MIRVSVLDDYDGSISKLTCWSRLSEDYTVRFLSNTAISQDIEEADVIVAVRERTPITREFIGQAKCLKHLALTGRLSGQADMNALKQRGIAVSYTEGSGSAAAELTIALTLGAAKGLHLRDAALRQKEWQIGPAMSLAGKTLGVLGLGRIGSRVAKVAKALDMQVVSWGPTPDEGRSEKLGVKRLELHDCLAQSDIVTVCLRLSDQTRGLLKSDRLALLRDGAILVNTSRAEIIERNALYSELKSGRISAALDVFHEEPLPVGDPLRSCPNVLLSPHMGYVTHEVYEIFFSQVVENILAWRSGLPFRDALQPE